MAKLIPSELVSNELADDGALYVSERKIYPRDVSGRFQTLRTAAVIWLLGMYYAFPWLRWDGRQAVLPDQGAASSFIRCERSPSVHCSIHRNTSVHTVCGQA